MECSWQKLSDERICSLCFRGRRRKFLRIQRDYSQLNTEYFGTTSPIVTGLNTDIQHSPPRVLLVLPVGVGVRYYFSDRIGISAESSYRIMSNDYLDGFSQSVDLVRGDHYYSAYRWSGLSNWKKEYAGMPGFPIGPLSPSGRLADALWPLVILSCEQLFLTGDIGNHLGCPDQWPDALPAPRWCKRYTRIIILPGASIIIAPCSSIDIIAETVSRIREVVSTGRRVPS